MKVQVTKVMAKFLNKEIPEFTFKMEKHTTGWWSDPDDYDCKTGMTKFITVYYPAQYYALPKSFSTKDLIQCFRQSDRTVEGFVKAVRNMVEI